MEFGGLVEYLENKTILITGGAGFVAKIFVEKILRSQPNVKKIYVLLRASDSNSARHRFKTQVMEKELFRLLRAKWEKKFDSFIWERVEVVCGDISDENYLLGIKNSNLRDQMFKDVDFIVNCAATTDFFERYDVALATNTIGILNLLSFAKKCIKLKKLLHLSTAYVSGERDGIVPEKAFEFGETLKKTFTKLDFEIEHELATHKLSQLRENEASEATINATMREFGIERTIDIIIASIGKGKMSFFLGKPTLIVDLILQMVANIPCLRCYKDVYAKNMKKLQTVMRFIQKFKHFALFNGIFEDTNCERLREELIKGSGNLEMMEAFNFDPNSIDWEDYIINTHIPGLIKYVII
ncbi:hypothetical protein CsatB_027955 [Cannabis sativa]